MNSIFPRPAFGVVEARSTDASVAESFSGWVLHAAREKHIAAAMTLFEAFTMMIMSYCLPSIIFACRRALPVCNAFPRKSNQFTGFAPEMGIMMADMSTQ
ncbi:hypothetical protein [Sphingorhabdus sp. YGSMI21]|uniref:hypothetical protein n=1 Tax=Sphingorhabdus sp. YGSMI21 TaxID=2077182 RepID=UPI0013D905DA|nr:hypothetical protein [Sphingorhabdus sp. YGSMI21]